MFVTKLHNALHNYDLLPSGSDDVHFSATGFYPKKPPGALFTHLVSIVCQGSNKAGFWASRNNAETWFQDSNRAVTRRGHQQDVAFL